MASVSVYVDYDGLKVNKLKDWMLNPLSTADRVSLGLTLGVNNKGIAVFDTTLSELYFWDGSAWVLSGGGGSVWGSITGTLSNQTDLQNALNLKANISSLATVAFSGSYIDLINKPIIPAAQVNSDWDAISGVAQILNKPTIYSFTGTTLEYTRGDGSYATFPTNISSFTNNVGYITASSVDTLTNKSGDISQWTNDVGYLTSVGTIPWSSITSTPTTLAGYGITDPVVLTTGSYANPSWITSLAYAKLTGAPTTLSAFTNDVGYITTISGIAAGGELSGTYPNPSLVNSAVIGKLLTGYISGAGTISASDSILSAIQKLNGNISTIPSLIFSTGLSGTTTITANISTGVSGGQTAIGGTGSGDNLTLSSTTNGTKGQIIFGGGGTFFSEVSNYMKIITRGLNNTAALTTGLWLKNTTAATSSQQQVSPRLTIGGAAWTSIAPAMSNDVDWSFVVTPVSNLSIPSSTLSLVPYINSVAQSAIFSFTQPTAGSGVLNIGTSSTDFSSYGASGIILNAGSSGFTGTSNNFNLIVNGTTGGNGSSLTIRAQPANATIVTTTGGALILISGSGGSTGGAGAITFSNGVTENGRFSGGPTGGNLLLGSTTDGGNGKLQVTGSAYFSIAIGIGTTPLSTSFATHAASTTAKSSINLAAGTTPSSPINGDMWATGTNLFFVRSGTTTETVFTGVSGATAPATNVGASIVSYYGSSSTNALCTPNSWASVVINGTTYKIPLYT